MRVWSFAFLGAAVFAATGATGGIAVADAAPRISGPFTHENLAVYLVHGADAPGPVPLTLQEAMAKGQVQVIETGRVNELQIENTGTDEVFVQAGDIVKGGRQDRVLTVSLLLPPKSGRMPIASFCVEHGRWSARGKEDQFKFSSAKEAMPSVAALAAMITPPSDPQPHAGIGASNPGTARAARGNDTVADKQRKVWDSVAATQYKLSRGLNAGVAAPQSATSLQLSLENEKLATARADYIRALEPAGGKDRDVVGYIIAINGNFVAGNVYSSNALFRKMWSKQLAAGVTEAIGEKVQAAARPAAAPAAPAATEFLAHAEKGSARERAITQTMRQEVRDSDDALYSEARTASGRWVHRSYLAK
jgi:hypothetical protein